MKRDGEVAKKHKAWREEGKRKGRGNLQGKGEERKGEQTSGK